MGKKSNDRALALALVRRLADEIRREAEEECRQPKLGAWATTIDWVRLCGLLGRERNAKAQGARTWVISAAIESDKDCRQTDADMAVSMLVSLADEVAANKSSRGRRE